MGPYAFSQAFLCGFFAFAALSSFVLWWGTRREGTLLTLSIVCTIGAVQSYAALLVASEQPSLTRNSPFSFER